LARFRPLFVAIVVLTVGSLRAATAPAIGPFATTDRACEFKDADVRWLQRALDGWEMVRGEFLKVEARPLPWIVLYDAACSWDLNPADPPLTPGARMLATSLTFAGEPVAVRAAAHRGTVLLPNRVEIPIEVKASTALYRNGRSTFFAMSMPSVWRADRRHSMKAFLDEYLQGVFSHELTHTHHLVTINRRLRQLVRDGDLPGRLNDDVIQGRFAKEPGFARAFEPERDLFNRAATLRDEAVRRDLVAKALELKRQRHARYFQGGTAVYAEIESLFLTMEGAGQWAAYRLVQARARQRPAEFDALGLVRDNRKYWSQDLGLALFMLLDAMVPGWQEQMFQPLPPSPFALLEKAVSTANSQSPPPKRDLFGSWELEPGSSRLPSF
jgi:hypothetical protein